jgi:hypothetical protein
MNHIILNASSAMMTWLKSIQFQTSLSKAQGSIRLILGRRNAALTSTFTNVLPAFGTLTARALKGSERAASRIARSVAYVIGITLFVPMSHASSGSIDAIEPKQFIRLSMDKKEAICLIRLYGKESAFNPYAIGNLTGKYHTYGIPQIKNPIIYDKTPVEQIKYGIKYIDHRYDGNACNAWSHWLRKGWH